MFSFYVDGELQYQNLWVKFIPRVGDVVAIVEDRRWRGMDIVELVDAFRKYEWL